MVALDALQSLIAMLCTNLLSALITLFLLITLTNFDQSFELR